MKKNKEKIMIAIITVLILLAVFMAFLFSNSQKMPSKIHVKNEDGKTIEAVLFGYKWRVFGKDTIADSIDPFEYNYSSTNTLLSRPAKNIRVIAEDKVIDVEGKYRFLGGTEEQVASFNQISSLDSINVNLPNTEGTYIYVFHITYAKGEADYGFKVVITDENVYEVNDLINYKDTSIIDYTKILSLLNDIPYADKIDGIIIDETSKSMKVRYDITNLEKEDLLNNAVAMFVLIPELDNITYSFNSGTKNNEIYYHRSELNSLFHRDISEYASDTESWAKEVIYQEENQKQNTMIEVYKTMLDAVMPSNTQDYADSCLVLTVSGDQFNEYDRKVLYTLLEDEFNSIINTSQNIEIKDATKLQIIINDVEPELLTCTYISPKGESNSKQFIIRNENGIITIQESIQEVEPQTEAIEGEEE